ncbi:hypothetical protein NX722_18990 [Endozoicomonas gorgoniicola]|uniref:Uncharacterized protein n=1 Tax=Endozoicomonas gorgoniicola TaxID=1234144 RepID=A0ABT3MZY5_9GAMM|nr:hypothetical protein [Endozoicomonas gorgoniicola]MCW7554668.1 hypothetical protein [Endozoicomonas gorgoniicola]
MPERPVLQPLYSILLSFLLLSAPARAFTETRGATPLTAEHILHQELLLNQLIVNIYLLQLDFLNSDAREKIQDNLTLLDTTIPNLPTQGKDGETSGLLVTTKALWPVISRHTTWMGNLPKQSRPPEADSLLMALTKLDRQLLLLRQKLMTQTPRQKPELNILEQALLMQRLSKEYLALAIYDQSSDIARSSRQQLQTLARHFDERMNRLNDQYQKHPYAGKPIRQAQTTWLFIANSIQSHRQKAIPEMVAIYSDRIVGKLTSVHKMF